MSRIKLICLDMDGTLLDDDHVTIPERNLRALRAAAERGIHVAISSGRAWELLREVAEQLGVVRYAVISNGAAVLDTWTGEWIVHRCLEESTRKALFALLKKWDLPFAAYCRGENFIQKDQVERAAALSPAPRFEDNLRRNFHHMEDLEAALEGQPVEKVHIFRVRPEDRAQVLAEAEACGAICVSTSFPDNMEITAGGVNKGSAVARLAEYLGLEADQVMAFGDAGNDVEMLRWAGWSFAMGNAGDEIKRIARFVTGTNHDGGVGMAIETYILNA